jgi:hypothetical protein
MPSREIDSDDSHSIDRYVRAGTRGVWLIPPLGDLNRRSEDQDGISRTGADIGSRRGAGCRVSAAAHASACGLAYSDETPEGAAGP